MSGSTLSENNTYPEFEEYSEPDELTPRHRPHSLAALCRSTRFSKLELKRIYQGFKTECPTGIVKEDTFKSIYSQFFPKGVAANTNQYAHYVFKALDHHRTGLLSFEDFVHGLSILTRGSIEDKLRWTFSLYDIKGDGHITRDELTDIVSSVYSIMGHIVDVTTDDNTVTARAELIFQKLDLNSDGVITIDEFLESCCSDKEIYKSIAALESVF